MAAACRVAAACFMLAACAVEPGLEGPGEAPFAERPLTQSRLSYDGDRELFRSLKVSEGRGRHAEAIELDGGVLLYEERPFGNFTEANLDPIYVAEWLDRSYRITENGFRFGPEDMEERSNRHGLLVYALLSKPDAHCFVFRQGATTRQPFEAHNYNILLSGHLCRPASVDSRQVLRLMSGFLSRLVFDGGALNRAAPAAATTRGAPAPAVAAPHPVALAVSWGAAPAELWVGSGAIDIEGNLEPFVLRRADGGVCRGRGDGPDRWAIDCDDGASAIGAFRQAVPGRGGGEGRDGQGRPVRLIFGP